MAPQAASRTKPPADAGMAELERKAAEASALLKLLANENRLLILCRLALKGEMSVNDIADAVGLSQSALSQHLAKMRDEGLVATRREAQTVFYRIADKNAQRLLMLLKDIYCP
jgi:ArsR family transcriptional regulator, virulence genes transcriptional regulator